MSVNLGGRVEVYNSKIEGKLELIEGWARAGLTNFEISKNLRVSVPTLEKYMKIHNELYDAVMLGREAAEVMVENALFKKAIGYSYREVTRERVKVFEEDDNGKMVWKGKWEVRKTKEVVKAVPAETAAIIYWLEHRAPRRWRREIEEVDNEPIEIIIKRKDGQVSTVNVDEEEF